MEETERRKPGGNELVSREPGKRQGAREVKPPDKRYLPAKVNLFSVNNPAAIASSISLNPLIADSIVSRDVVAKLILPLAVYLFFLLTNKNQNPKSKPKNQNTHTNQPSLFGSLWFCPRFARASVNPE